VKNVVQDLTSAGLDWDREKWRGSVASKFIRGGEKNAVKYADEIIVLSKDVQKYFLEAFKNVKTDKKLVIAGGSSDTDSFMEELKELAKGDDRIYYVMLPMI